MMAVLEAGRWIDASLLNKNKMVETIADKSYVNTSVDAINQRILGRYQNDMDVDEAVLLSDRIVMMTTPVKDGPAATIGEVLRVDLPRPRDRVALTDNADYVHCRKAVLDFLYTRQAHAETTPA